MEESAKWVERKVGSRCTLIPKDQFPSLIKILLSNLINGKENIIAGFKKNRIFALNKQEVLARLPKNILQNEQTSQAIKDSFIDYLNERGNSIIKQRPVNSCRKVVVTPGKSISVTDIE